MRTKQFPCTCGTHVSSQTLASKFLTPREVTFDSPEQLWEAVTSEEFANRVVARANNQGSLVTALHEPEFFFRGQRDESWGLSSSLVRAIRGDQNSISEHTVSNAEMQIVSSMRDEGLGYNATDLQLLMMMQHHQIPTRLVDVSMKPLASLFFACEKGWTDGRLFVIAVDRDGNSGTVDRSNSSDELWWSEFGLTRQNSKRPWTTCVYLIDEEPIDPRMLAQSGRFLVGGIPREDGGVQFTHPEDGRPLKSHEIADITSLAIDFGRGIKSKTLVRGWKSAGWSVRIPSCWKASIMDLLRRVNITEDSMYPSFDECERLAKSIASNSGVAA